MTLTDGEVAALASQVAELISSSLAHSPNVDVRISPSSQDDPYRWGSGSAGWLVYFDVDPAPGNTVAVRIDAGDSPASALYRLIDGLDEVSETDRYRGVAFPVCRPGHTHPARVREEGADVVLRCPQTDEVVARLAVAPP